MSRRSPVSSLESHLGYWLRSVSNQVSHAFLRKVEAQGLTVAEWVVLRLLYEAPPVSPSQLADRLGMTRGAISKLVERLARKQLLERTDREEDRRFQSVVLTAAGKRLVPILARLADRNDEEFFGHLTRAQRKDLLRLLQDLAHRHGPRPAPVD